MEAATIAAHAEDKQQGKKRSSRWPSVRAAFLRKNPACAVCGAKTRLQAHHLKPFHLHPELELDPNNLIPLCEGRSVINCHLIAGHGKNFRDINPFCRETALLLHWLFFYNQAVADQAGKFDELRKSLARAIADIITAP